MARSRNRLSAGVVLVRETPDGARFLLLRAYRHWDCPKGVVEPGEEPLDAAVRETAEETGIDDLEFAWGHDYHETPPYAGGKVARYYV
ncbi:MAG: NUDIX domain-containing protein, partial [Gammaproteobacteria bacterium]